MRTSLDDEQDNVTRRHIDDVLDEIRSHLTKEELLCVSLFKNSRRQSNNIHRIFLKKYHGKMLATSTISMRKKRMFNVLNHVGALLEYKRTNNVNMLLRKVLTNRQCQILEMYERRKTNNVIKEMLNIKERAIERCYKRILKRLEDSSNPAIQRYLELLINVLRFSRKSTYSDEKKPVATTI